MAAVAESVSANARSAIRAAIRRASRRGREDLRRLDAALLGQVETAYRDAAQELRVLIESYAPGEETLRTEVLGDLLADIYGRLTTLERGRNDLLSDGLARAADLGTQPFVGWVSSGAILTAVADDAVRFVTRFTAEDGLQLSDRLWRIDNGAREVIAREVRQAVVLGRSASQAASEFLARGENVPADIRRNLAAARGGQVGRVASAALVQGDASARANALRVFRTEINRAHGEAYQAAAFEHPDAIGTRFLLSPNHPRVDICDMHASVNRYGLGPGVYPKGRNPWPAHPNTLSFVEVVFADEVSDADRAGKEGRIDWLKTQPPGTQEAVLGSRMKRTALLRGALRENEIATPWKNLKARYARRGVRVDRWADTEPADAAT